jgi:hypothetical protein
MVGFQDAIQLVRATAFSRQTLTIDIRNELMTRSERLRYSSSIWDAVQI